MKIVIPGGSGQVGTLLARAFVADGHEVVVLSRKSRKSPWPVVRWDGKTLGELAHGLLHSIDGETVTQLAAEKFDIPQDEEPTEEQFQEAAHPLHLS